MLTAIGKHPVDDVLMRAYAGVQMLNDESLEYEATNLYDAAKRAEKAYQTAETREEEKKVMSEFISTQSAFLNKVQKKAQEGAKED